MEFTRVTKKYVTIPVTATLPANAPATISGVDVALLPVGYKPTSGTTWTAATYAAGIATILIAGPDADATGAVVLAADSDLWIRVTDSPEVDAVKVTRLSVPSPRPAPTPAVNYVTPAQLTAALAGISGGGGGAVASVNGHTGVVVLGASDVGAQAAGSYVTTADARLTDQRVPTDSSVTDGKVATGAAINADKLADGTTNKLLTATERTKLAGIATGATANATDAALRDRATHTGTQSADTLTDGTTNKAFLATERTKLTGIATGATANATDAQLRDRSTHTGTQSADTITDGTTNKAFLATERTKLTGIATGATANSSDATLLARANHTGTQAASTITGLATVATTGAYADLTGTPAAYTDEQARDAVGTALVAGSGVTITVNDPADTITIASTGGGAQPWPSPGPAFGVLTASFDPALAPTAGASQGTGKILLARIPWTRDQLVTNIHVYVNTAGATLTSGQNLACLYDSAGNQISGSTTADQSTAWTSTGAKTMPVGTAQTIAADANGYLYVALLTVGTTIPLWLTAPSTAVFANVFIPSNVGQRGGLLASTGNTSLPASATLTTMTVAKVPLVALS